MRCLVNLRSKKEYRSSQNLLSRIDLETSEHRSIELFINGIKYTLSTSNMEPKTKGFIKTAANS